jgi:hypothetical protein
MMQRVLEFLRSTNGHVIEAIFFGILVAWCFFMFIRTMARDIPKKRARSTIVWALGSSLGLIVLFSLFTELLGIWQLFLYLSTLFGAPVGIGFGFLMYPPTGSAAVNRTKDSG